MLAKDAYAVAIPISNYANRIKKLKENTLENVKMDTNLITGTIKADKDEKFYSCRFLTVKATQYALTEETQMLSVQV